VAARRTAPRGTSRFEVGSVNLPHPAEKECGDGWAWFEEGQRAAVFVADGLGHGPGAASAARAAVERFLERVAQPPEEILQSVHGVLRPTRGAAAAAAVIDPLARELTFSGVGNVAGAILGPGTTRALLSHNGTLGHEAHKILPYRYPVPARALLVLNTDGLVTQWRLDGYPGLAARHPSVIAGVLYRDFRRLRDDVTVVVIRIREEGS
jgi:hypothetical protein